MTIKQYHLSKLYAFRQAMRNHRLECADETEQCTMCNNIASMIDHHETAVNKIDAGIRQFRIASQ